MKAIGTNLSNASFIPTCPYRNARKHGGRYRCGVHDVLLAEGALLTVTQTMTMTMMMMRAIAMMATTTAETIEGAITMNHEDENSTNPPRHCDAPPLCTSHDCNLILPPLWNTIQNGGSMMRIFCIQVGRSMFQSLTILGLGHGSSETVIKVHY